MNEARLWAKKNGAAVLPANDKEAADVIVQALIRNDPKVAGSEELQAKIRKNWMRDLKGRIATADPAQALSVQNAINQNYSNPTFSRIVGKHGPDTVVFAKPEDPNSSRAGERIGFTSFMYESPYQADNRDEAPKPRAATSAEHGGIAAELRHEYGHFLLDHKTSEEFRRQFGGLLPDAKEIKAGLTSYAAKNRDETFCELFATVTSNHYDPSAFPDWVQKAGAAVLKELLR